MCRWLIDGDYIAVGLAVQKDDNLEQSWRKSLEARSQSCQCGYQPLDTVPLMPIMALATINRQ